MQSFGRDMATFFPRGGLIARGTGQPPNGECGPRTGIWPVVFAHELLVPVASRTVLVCYRYQSCRKNKMPEDRHDVAHNTAGIALPVDRLGVNSAMIWKTKMKHWSFLLTIGLVGALFADLSVAQPNDADRDHLHPNDAGYQAIANAVDLSILAGR